MTSSIGGAIRDGVHRLETRVYHEDTDYTGVVYHASYLRFAERGRSDMLRLAGIRHEALQRLQPPVALMVYRMEIDFLGAARIGETLRVETRLDALSRTRMDLLQEIRRESGLLWRARVAVIAATPGERARRLPAQLMEAFSALHKPPGA